MKANEYQELAARTINPRLYDYEIEQHAIHGLAGEVGELHSIYQKCYQGHDFDEEHAKKELGDLLWFVAEYCTAMNWELDEVMELNIEKLMKRYPDGFEDVKSINREKGDI
jgi:NTP pyrophosphatase (non-canonical NTP hydrolase)